MTHRRPADVSETGRPRARSRSESSVLDALDRYYDTAPRAGASTEEVGPFTLFLRTDPALWHYYARPRRGLPAPATITARDVTAVLDRQRELGVPPALEWVHETTPSLLGAAREAGMSVEECPLMVLGDPSRVEPVASRAGLTVGVLDADSPDLPEVMAAVHAGFSQTDDVEPPGPDRVERRRRLIGSGLIRTVAAYDETGAVVGGGSHGPRGTTTEVAGVAVLPRARRRGAGSAITRALAADALGLGVTTVFLGAQDDAVARVYARVGFARVGTACVATPSEPDRARAGSRSDTSAQAREAEAQEVEAREVGGDDWRAWRDLRLRALQDAPSAFGSTYARERDFGEDLWRDRLDDPHGVAVLAFADATPVGMGAGFQDLPGWLHVVAMWVDPAWRGRRVGHRVLDAVRAWAEARGLRLHLDVAEGNGAARASYERYGFEATGESRPIREDATELVERMVLPAGGAG